MSRIETRSLPLSLRDLAVEPVVADVLAMVAPLARAEQVTLHTAPVTTSVLVHADERRVRQVLLNLVTNALRYHHPGGRVLVGWVVDEGQVRITVQDNGPASARTTCPALRPLRPARPHLDEGVGLGLPLARG